MSSDLSSMFGPHIAAMWAERDGIVQRVAHAVTSSVPSYARTPSSEVWIGMTRILERAVHGDPFAPPVEEDRLAAVGTGVQGAGAGIAADDLVTAVLLGAREVERDVLDRAAGSGIDAIHLLEASRRFRSWAEQAAVWALQGLLGANAGTSSQHVRQAQLIAALRAGEPGSAQVLADEADLDRTERRLAVVIMGPAGVPIEAAMALRIAEPASIWGDMPGPGDDAQLVGLVRSVPRIPDGLVAGVAGPDSLESLGWALHDAARAARVGRRFGRLGPVTLAELGLLVPLYEDKELGARLHERWLQPLASEPRHDLVATLRAWLACDGQVDAVARRLNVHANTVRNRLARMPRLLGDDWRAPQHRAELWAALQIQPSEFVGTST